MIHPAPRSTETWTPREWLLVEKLVMALRRVPHRVIFEVRRERDGEIIVFEVKRHEEIRIDGFK